MPTKKPNKTKIELEILVAVVVALVIIISVLLLGGQQTQPAKVSIVPTEIKSQPEAASLEKDTSSILSEVGDALTNIDASLPEV